MMNERAAGQPPHPVGGTRRRRIGTPYFNAVLAQRETLRKAVRDAFNAARLITSARQLVADHRDLHGIATACFACAAVVCGVV